MPQQHGRHGAAQQGGRGQVFGLPGLGYTAVHAIEQQDLPVIIGIVLVASAGVVVANILADLFYAVLDPRIRIN